MKPEKLVLSAWGPFKEEETVDFSAMQRGGLFLITGATGAGKTTIFDGITFALYGEVSGSIREKDSVRSDFAGPAMPTCVTLYFTHKGEHYRIRRNPKYDRPKLRGEGYTIELEAAQLYREKPSADGMHRGGKLPADGMHRGGKPSADGMNRGGKLSADGMHRGGKSSADGLYQGEELLACGGQQVSDEVRKLLGLDCHQFKQISMIAQGEFLQLLVASSKERTQIFRDIFQTRLYDVIAVKLSGMVKRLTAEADEIKHREDEIIGIMQIESEEWETQKQKKNKNYPEISRLAEQELEKIKERLKAAEAASARLEKEYKSQVQRIEQWKNQNKAIQKYEEDVKRLEELGEQREGLAKELKSREEEYKKLPKERAAVTSLREELKALEDQKKHLSGWQKAGSDLEKQQRSYLALDAEAKEKKADYEYQDDLYKKAAAGILARDLQEGMSCPVCGSTHHPALARAGEDLPDEKQLKKLKRDYEKAWEKAADAQNKAAVLVGSMKTMVKQLAGLDLSDGGEAAMAGLEEAVAGLKTAVREKEEQIVSCEKAYQAAKLKLERVKAAYEQQRAGIRPPADMEKRDVASSSEALAQMEKERRSARREREELSARQEGIRRALTALKGHMARQEKLGAEYGVVREVERAANGYNNRNLVLEQYVLSVYFDDILEAANRRLLSMTGDRYELYRQPESRDRRTKEGMELEVLDQYTGKRRSVKTLSGGESFKAALSLALGTSDVVQSYAGGIAVEALFIDEGFGSLDAESLQQAVEILTHLSGDSRMVGIISHVEELKEQIDNQILVEKNNQGSRILS